MQNKKAGFTIVELLIVIVVIAILAAVTIVAYNGIQSRARDSQRMSDIAAIDKAIKLYIVDKGHAPDFGGVCAIANSGNDGSCFVGDHDGAHQNNPTGYPHTWSEFAAELEPYMKKVPVDPCGIKCWREDEGEYYVYRYNAPGQLPDEYTKYNSSGVAISTTTPRETDYAIYAETLESNNSAYGFGFASFR